MNWGEKAEDISLKYFPSHDSALPRVKGGSAMQDLFRSKLMHLKPLLLGSMYFWSWLIQLNRKYKYNEKIARFNFKRPYLETGRST